MIFLRGPENIAGENSTVRNFIKKVEKEQLYKEPKAVQKARKSMLFCHKYLSFCENKVEGYCP